MASFIVYGDASGQVTVQAPSVAGSNTITFPAETGTLVTSASTTMPNTIVWNTTVRTSGFTAAIDSGNFCNTTGGAFTVTLPATPARGDFVVIIDYAGTSASNNITVSGNGANINGTSSNATLATNRQGITFTYIDSTRGWLATSNVYGGSSPFTQSYTASYLVVAGGGGSGVARGGGGGAGGYLAGTISLTSGTVYTATVGGGGAGAVSSSTIGTQGSNSTFPGVTTAVGGGGAGGGSGSNRNGTSGGSGGGGGGSNPFGTGGAGTPGQGNNGGNGVNDNGCGAGGGSGSVGSNGSGANGGAGGAGTASSITGTPAFYAGGGGGGGGNSGGAGGLGGPGTPGVSGGNGGGSGVNGGSAVANTGGGGGGGGGPGGTSAAGASGVVILSVPTSNYTGTVTGSPTVTTSGLNTIIRFTSTGTYTA